MKTGTNIEIEIEIEIVFIILKSTQSFSKRKAVTVRKRTIPGDALLTPSCHGGGWPLV